MSKDFNELKERITNFTDEALIDLVGASSTNYRKEAIEFAVDELKTRGFLVRQGETGFHVENDRNLDVNDDFAESEIVNDNLSSSKKVPFNAYALGFVIALFFPAFISAVGLELGGTFGQVGLLFVTFLIIGLVLAYVWHEVGWRWGLLIGISLGLLSFFSKTPLATALEALLILVAGCLGGYLGEKIKERKLSRVDVV